MPRRMLSLFRNLLRKEGVEKLLDEELRSSLEILAQEKIQEGMDPGEARRQARIELGGMEQVKMKVREARFGTALETVWQDVRYGLRMLRKNPGFTVVAALTLGVGIGANTVLFSIVDKVLLQPLPYEDPHELVVLRSRSGNFGNRMGHLSGPDIADFRLSSQLFEGLAHTQGAHQSVLAGDGLGLRVKHAYVSWNFFSLLGVKPLLGRNFSVQDSIHLDRNKVWDPKADLSPGPMILSHDFWQRQFGGAESVLGKMVDVQGIPREIVGVFPPTFAVQFPPDVGIFPGVDIWTVDQFDPRRLARSAAFLRVLGRLKSGATLSQAQAEAEIFSEGLRERFLSHKRTGFRLEIASLYGEIVGGTRTVLLLVWGVLGLVLLIVCANVAGLVLSRAGVREREVVLRMALGAGRARVVRQLLVENLLLAFLGAGFGILISRVSLDLFLWLRPISLPRLQETSLAPKTLLFALALTFLAPLLFGLFPSLRITRVNLVDILKSGGRASGQSWSHNRFLRVLAVVQIALSLVVLTGAGLLVRSYQQLQGIDLGFATRNTVTATVSMAERQHWNLKSRTELLRRLEAALSATAGIESVGSGFAVPFAGLSRVQPYSTEQSMEGSDSSQQANQWPVTPGFLEVLGVRLVGGRFFRWEDLLANRKVVVVDERLAHRAWPDQRIIGKRVRVRTWRQDGYAFRGGSEWAEVIGIAGEIRTEGPDKRGREMIYVPYHLVPYSDVVLAMESTLTPGMAAKMIENTVRTIDSNLAVSNVRLLESYVRDSMAPMRFAFQAISLFALIAVVLAFIGVYGVLSYAVSSRVREIGIRIALGAPPGRVLRLVIRQGLTLAWTGIVTGLVLSAILSRFMRGFLHGISNTDPLTYGSAILFLLAVICLACWVPARRATQVDPMVALRYE